MKSCTSLVYYLLNTNMSIGYLPVLAWESIIEGVCLDVSLRKKPWEIVYTLAKMACTCKDLHYLIHHLKNLHDLLRPSISTVHGFDVRLNIRTVNTFRDYLTLFSIPTLLKVPYIDMVYVTKHHHGYTFQYEHLKRKVKLLKEEGRVVWNTPHKKDNVYYGIGNNYSCYMESGHSIEDYPHYYWYNGSLVGRAYDSPEKVLVFDVTKSNVPKDNSQSLDTWFRRIAELRGWKGKVLTQFEPHSYDIGFIMYHSVVWVCKEFGLIK